MQKFRRPLEMLLSVSAVLLYFLSSTFAAPKLPLNFDGWIGEALQKLETDGITGGFHRNTAPDSRTAVFRIIRQAETRIRTGAVVPSEIDRKLLEKLKREFQVDSGEQERATISLLPQLRATAKKRAFAAEGAFHYQYRNLTLYTESEFQNFEDFHRQGITTIAKGKSAEQRLEPWRGGYTGNVKKGYLQWATRDARLNLLVGRNTIFWGASPENSVGISENSPPFDMVRLTGTFSKFKASAFTAQLDSTWYDDGKTRYLAKRYFSAHRLEYQHNDRLNIGIAEWVLYGGDAQTLDFKYANPITFYYALQYNAKTDDNLMFAFDAAFRPIDGLRLYAEWLIDDFQYVPGADDPHAVAGLLGLEWYPERLARCLGVHTEYVRVNRWAYTHLVPENQFTHFEEMLGHPIGTDADTLSLSVSYQWTPDTKSTSTIKVSRNGEATVADRFYGEDFNALPFPTGVIEYATQLGGSISYRPLASWNIGCFYAWQAIQNWKHNRGETYDEHRLAFYIGYLL